MTIRIKTIPDKEAHSLFITIKHMAKIISNDPVQSHKDFAQRKLKIMHARFVNRVKNGRLFRLVIA